MGITSMGNSKDNANFETLSNTHSLFNVENFFGENLSEITFAFFSTKLVNCYTYVGSFY